MFTLQQFLMLGSRRALHNEGKTEKQQNSSYENTLGPDQKCLVGELVLKAKPTKN